MSGNDNAERERPLKWMCYPFLAIGSEGAQLMMAVLGLFLICSVYNINPDIKNAYFKGNGWWNLIPILILVIGLPLISVLSAMQYRKILWGGEITSAELYRVEPCRFIDSYEFTFLVSDSECPVRRFEMTRDCNDMYLGTSVTVLVNAKLGIGWLERDLPCGITFAHLFGWEPVPGTSWLMMLVIPVLTPVPLLGLIGPVAAFVQLHSLYWWPFILQFIWYGGNRKRFFCPGEPFQLNPRRGRCPKCR